MAENKKIQSRLTGIGELGYDDCIEGDSMQSSRGAHYHGALAECPRRSQLGKQDSSMGSTGTVTNIAMQMGTLAHHLVEFNLLTGKSPEAIAAEILAERGDLWDVLEANYSGIVQAAHGFLSHVKGAVKLSVEQELRWDDPEDSRIFYTQRVDFIYQIPDGIVLTDWKTTSKGKADPDRYRWTLQGVGYWFLGRHIFQNVAAVEFVEWDFVAQELRVVGVPAPRELLENFPQMVRYLHRAHELADPYGKAAPALPGRHCQWCPFSSRCFSI